MAKYVSSKELYEVEILSGRYLKKPIDGIDYITDSLPLKIVGAGCHGKFLYWILDNDISIWNTLGLTGEWSKERKKNSRVRFLLENDEVYYNDTRNFGTIKIVKGRQALIQKLQSLGPDLLAEECSSEKFIERMRLRNSKTIVEALMDQKIVAGVGNYIKADSLWLAKISPHRKVSELSDNDLSKLNDCIRKIMTTSFELGGATIYTYKNFDGSIGEYGSKFLVYNKKVDPEGNLIIKETTRDKRTTHWSPDVQN